MLFVRHALLAVSLLWPPTTLFLHLNVVLPACGTASCIPFRPRLTGDICTVAFICQDRTLPSFIQPTTCTPILGNDLQQMTAVQQEAKVVPPPTPLSHLNPLN